MKKTMLMRPCQWLRPSARQTSEAISRTVTDATAIFRARMTFGPVSMRVHHGNDGRDLPVIYSERPLPRRTTWPRKAPLLLETDLNDARTGRGRRAALQGRQQLLRRLQVRLDLQRPGQIYPRQVGPLHVVLHPRHLVISHRRPEQRGELGDRVVVA